MNETSTRRKISASLFALDPVTNLPRGPIEELRKKITKRYEELLAQPESEENYTETESENG